MNGNSVIFQLHAAMELIIPSTKVTNDIVLSIQIMQPHQQECLLEMPDRFQISIKNACWKSQNFKTLIDLDVFPMNPSFNHVLKTLFL